MGNPYVRGICGRPPCGRPSGRTVSDWLRWGHGDIQQGGKVGGVRPPTKPPMSHIGLYSLLVIGGRMTSHSWFSELNFLLPELIKWD